MAPREIVPEAPLKVTLPWVEGEWTKCSILRCPVSALNWAIWVLLATQRSAVNQLHDLSWIRPRLPTKGERQPEGVGGWTEQDTVSHNSVIYLCHPTLQSNLEGEFGALPTLAHELAHAVPSILRAIDDRSLIAMGTEPVAYIFAHIMSSVELVVRSAESCRAAVGVKPPPEQTLLVPNKVRRHLLRYGVSLF